MVSLEKLVRMLRDDVYKYLWDQIKNKLFVPGEFIDLNSIAKKLNVSRTPLREALIVLENEGFVKILPKKGIYINPITLQDTNDLYEIIGALESSIIINEWDKITDELIDEMEAVNRQILDTSDYELQYDLNKQFHFLYINLSGNVEMKEYLARLYRRIYDFSGINFGAKFQQNNVHGHEIFITLLREKNKFDSANYIRDVHWKFRVPEIFTNN